MGNIAGGIRGRRSLPILKKKPFDEHEGEGALFATGKAKQKGTTDPLTPLETGSTSHEKATGDTKPADPTVIPAEVKEEKEDSKNKETLR